MLAQDSMAPAVQKWISGKRIRFLQLILLIHAQLTSKLVAAEQIAELEQGTLLYVMLTVVTSIRTAWATPPSTVQA